VQPQLAGQHDAGRSATGNDHVNHETPSTRLHFGRLLRAGRRRAHPHLRAEYPQPHRRFHRRFDVPRDPHVDKARVLRKPLISAGSGFGGRFCSTTRVLPQAPRYALH
jgi:hypothetical protein